MSTNDSSTPELVTMGETMALLSTPGQGLLRHAATVDLTIGGSESNVAIGLCRLGLTAAWIGRVGEDEFGQLVLRELRGEGVQVHAATDPDAVTGLMVKQRRSNGAGRVWYYRAGSAGSRLSPEDVDPALINGSRVVHLTGITPALSPSARAATQEIAQQARAAGVTVSLDLNYRRALWSPEDFRQAMLALLPQTDVVFASPHEAGHIVGDRPPLEQALALQDLGPAEVVLKQGAAGALGVGPTGSHHCPAMPVPVIDTVGAGDAFVAGWLAEFIRGADSAQRMQTATGCGAFACTVPGDWEGFPSPADLALLQQPAVEDFFR